MSRPKVRIAPALALLTACCLGLGSGLVAPAAARETYAVSLRVEAVRVKKDETAKLTAIVKPAGTCTRRAVLFQVKRGGGWEKLGKKITVGSSCHVSRKAKVGSKSVFRVLLIDRKKSTTLVTSPSVTVDVK